ncbi:MAG TPA: EamA family transporter [Aggregatilinea sp.]|uniref:DMT family transporter n=1 Tax=Aggregatilinea sp. TaxID=2806333 RepID=UPI002C01E0C5|nr:EamA family transporter [Aggregatilinea sp.]HML23165.1 EamA family transporter [Aggregatilinea sp.]
MAQVSTKTLVAPSQGSRVWQGIALITTGAICFSTAIIFIRWTDDLPTTTINFYRALFAFLFLLSFTPHNREPLHVRAYRAQIPRLLVLGTLVCSTALLYTYGVQNTTAANAALLNNSAPLYVAVLGPLVLKEPRGRTVVPSLILAIVGIVLISDPTKLKLNSDNFAGIIASAVSGLTYAVLMITSRGLGGRINGLTQNLWTTGFITVALLPLALRSPSDVVLHNLPVLIPMGILSFGLPYLLYFYGLSRTPVQVVSIVALMEPVAGIVIGILMFGETLGEVGALGAALILGSIVLITRGTPHAPRGNAVEAASPPAA